MNDSRLFRIELDDYATPAFVSGGKYYFGTMDQIKEWIAAIESNEDIAADFSKLSAAFHAYRSGDTNVTHPVAFNQVPFLKPALLMHREEAQYAPFEWEHTNVWGFPYYMKCDRADAAHLWLKCGCSYYRYILVRFENLQYKSVVGGWKPLNERFWGFPEVLVEEGTITRNRLAEREKTFLTPLEADADWKAFCAAPTPDFSEFCNDIFGDG